MGNQGNIVIEQEDGRRVFYYTNPDGRQLPEMLANALNGGRDAWSDATELARSILCDMVKEEEFGLKGYGINIYIEDSVHNSWIIHPSTGRVTEETREGKVVASWSFEEFIKAHGQGHARSGKRLSRRLKK